MGKRGAIVGGILTIALGLAVVVGAVYFSDWSGQHRISWPGVAVGVVIASAGALRTFREVRRR
jgi:hypothetical protein